MSVDPLTTEQKLFLEQCESEFCNRFTDLDMEYRNVKEAGIPPPPIMYPWNPKLIPRNKGATGSKYSHYRHDRYKPQHYRSYSNHGSNERQYR